MNCAIILTANAKQVVFTPENDMEKSALSMITVDDEINIASNWGTFQAKPRGFGIDMCRGGYIRAWEDSESLMLTLTKKVTEPHIIPDELQKIDELLDALDIHNGDAPHRAVNRLTRITVLATGKETLPPKEAV